MASSIQPLHDNQANEKSKILLDIRSYCVSYAGFSLARPDMFGDAPQETDLCQYLLQNMDIEVKLPTEFLNELAKRFHEDGLINIIGSTVIGISEEIASINFNENYLPAIRVCPYLFTLIVGYEISRSVQVDSINHARYTQLDPHTNNSIGANH